MQIQAKTNHQEMTDWHVWSGSICMANPIKLDLITLTTLQSSTGGEGTLLQIQASRLLHGETGLAVLFHSMRFVHLPVLRCETMQNPGIIAKPHRRDGLKPGPCFVCRLPAAGKEGASCLIVDSVDRLQPKLLLLPVLPNCFLHRLELGDGGALVQQTDPRFPNPSHMPDSKMVSGWCQSNSC